MNPNYVEKKEAQEEREREAKAEVDGLRIAYRKAFGDNDTVLMDIIGRLKNLIEFHSRLAKDGTGFRGQEFVVFNGEQRLSHIDKAAGLGELSDVIDRLLTESIDTNSEEVK